MTQTMYFGAARDAPAWEEMQAAPTPVDATCIWCRETIGKDDDGVIYANGPVAHGDCFVRQAVGGVNHILGRCVCCGGTEEPDPPGMTAREAATAAVRLFEHRGYG